jgi:signal transduction histidine kinase
MFGRRPGLALSGLVWLAYGINVGLEAWPDRLLEYYPNYFSFFLAPYVIAVVLTVAVLRQAADRRRVQGLYDELRLAHEQLQILHRRDREAAVAEERNRLAREIHDSLAHYLTVINVQLEAAEKLALTERERALEAVRRARRLAHECLQEVRRSVGTLRATSPDELSLPRALDKLAREFTENTGIVVRLELQLGGDVRPAPETALALYRAAQEGLTNVHRHARATSVDLTLVASDGKMELALQDDGVGPTENGDRAQEGFGLLGLRERVELLGGQVRFGRAPTGGSRLTVALPIAGAVR